MLKWFHNSPLLVEIFDKITLPNSTLSQKNVALFPEIGLRKIFLSITRPHSRMCVSEYVVLIKKRKKDIKLRKVKKKREPL